MDQKKIELQLNKTHGSYYINRLKNAADSVQHALVPDVVVHATEHAVVPDDKHVSLEVPFKLVKKKPITATLPNIPNYTRQQNKAIHGGAYCGGAM